MALKAETVRSELFTEITERRPSLRPPTVFPATSNLKKTSK
jgi:hypothetical protein